MNISKRKFKIKLNGESRAKAHIDKDPFKRC